MLLWVLDLYHKPFRCKLVGSVKLELDLLELSDRRHLWLTKVTGIPLTTLA
jgi:hypothetical protein